MQILANENVPGDAVAALRQQRHAVAWVREDVPGDAKDPCCLILYQASKFRVT